MTTLQFKNVYVKSEAAVVGPLEKKGPLGEYFDFYFDDNYCGEKTFEKAERRLIKEAVTKTLERGKIGNDQLDLAYGGDLINQCTSSNYFAKELNTSFISVYGACSNAALVIGSSAIAIEHLEMKHVLAFTSSHVAAAERQFRYPNEYGGQKKATTTSTVTGAGAVLLNNQKQLIQVTSFTIGKIIDWQFDDVHDMGKAMVPAAYDTLMTHFKDLNRTFDDYDLIVTGDLSKIGYAMLAELCQNHRFQLKNKLNDCGIMIYDINEQEVFCGGSGCGCSMVVTVTKLFDMLKKKEANRILLISTGALLSPVATQQKKVFPALLMQSVLKGANKMIYVSAFLCCGLLCAVAQLLYDNTRLTPGHITSMFVVFGALLESFDLYDRIITICGMGANLPITSFGHSLAHASYAGALEKGWLGIFSNVFDKSSSGMAFAIFMAFVIAIIFRPKS